MSNLNVKTTASNKPAPVTISTNDPIIGIPYTPYNFDASDDATLFQLQTGVGAKPTLDGDPVGYVNGLLGAGSPGHVGASPVYRPGVLNDLAVIEARSATSEYLEIPDLLGAISSAYWSVFGIVKVVDPLVAGDFIFGVGENGFGPWQTDDGVSLIAVTNTTGTINLASSISGSAASQIDVDTVTDTRGGFYLYENHTTPAASVSYINGTEEGRDDAWRGTQITPDYMRMFASGTFGIPPGTPSVPGNFTNAMIGQVVYYPSAITTQQKNAVRSFLMNKWLPLSPFLWLP